ncbi:hypothetical protein MMC31_006737 [Peltigera leucophlebia]|nr:hypothetical protein [Peltigera leucophlebia]
MFSWPDSANGTLLRHRGNERRGEKALSPKVYTFRKGNGKYGVVDGTWKVWRKSKPDGILAGNLSDVTAKQESSLAANAREEKHSEEGLDEVAFYSPSSLSMSVIGSSSNSQKVFLGGKGPRLVGRRYGRVLQKPRMDSAETLNTNYVRRKGFEQSEKIKEQGWRRVKLSRSEEEEEEDEVPVSVVIVVVAAAAI